jgi:hypothetical protein
MAKTGRPTKQEPEKRNKLMQVRMRAADMKRFNAAAIKAGLDLSGWVRSRLLNVARQELGT